MAARRRNYQESVAAIVVLLQAEDLANHGTQDGIIAVVVAAVLATRVVAIAVATLEALAEVVAVLIRIDVIAAVAVIGILVGIRSTRVIAPVIHAIRAAGIVAFLVTVVDRLPEQVRAVAVDFVITSAAV